MAVRIRLRRTGKRNAACHRIVVADARSPRDGRFIENIGLYDPRHKNETIDMDRVDYWLAQGAQPSETVAAVIKRGRAGMLRDGATAEEVKPAQKAKAAPVQEAPVEDVAEPTETTE